MKELTRRLRTRLHSVWGVWGVLGVLGVLSVLSVLSVLGVWGVSERLRPDAVPFLDELGAPDALALKTPKTPYTPYAP